MYICGAHSPDLFLLIRLVLHIRNCQLVGGAAIILNGLICFGECNPRLFLPGCTQQVTGPHIILLPKSVLGNWQLEFKRFCPSVKVLRLSGNKVLYLTTTL